MATPYRLPAGTTEITYTRGAGEQRSIPIQDLGDGYLFAQGADADDDAHLVGLGYPVARKVLGEDEPTSKPKPKARGKAASRTKTSPAAAESLDREAAPPAPPAETTAGEEV